MKRVTIFVTAIVLIAVIFLVSGCKLTEKKKAYYKNLLCTDSVSTIINNVPVEIPVYYDDSTYSTLWIECNEQNQIEIKNAQYYQGKYTKLQATIDSNKLTIVTRTIIKDKIVYVKKDTTIFKQVIKEVEKSFKRFDSFLLVCGWIFWALIVATLLFFLIRFLIKKYVLKK